MTALTVFSTVSAALDAGAASGAAARDREFTMALAGSIQDDYLPYHAVQARELNLSEFVNSYCLPVYALPPSSADQAQAARGRRASGSANASLAASASANASSTTNGNPNAGVTASKSASSGGKGQRRTKRGARTVRDANLTQEVAEADLLAGAMEALEEEYTTRSGRQTKKRMVVNGDGPDDDASFEGDESVDLDDDLDDDVPVKTSGGKGKKRKKRRSNVNNNSQLRYSVAFADKVGNYPYTVDVDVDASELASVRVDASGRVVSNSLPKLKEGDKIIMDSGDANAMSPQEYLDSSMLTGRAVRFAGQRERFISKLTGLKGELIHPTKLYDAVKAIGGFDYVVANHLWQKVRNKLSLPNTSSSGFVLRRTFEEYFVKN
eukprot:CAMPEP_0171510072 /NCGR_PEP_ID=MMETSP0959-20130129/153_1 /TAXON_ID=87120 /ORGANISM="Aurantiochytrium limacinum, Strain ATCCMYA-1381" /LENGTH=379 /DNA_ID=CAMNT_0012047381 /DNA_START=59 /DNA_END=1198 /DNA_ORIENTATION=+